MGRLIGLVGVAKSCAPALRASLLRSHRIRCSLRQTRSRVLVPLRMGRPTGLEPATPRFTILCSNQLSYDRRKMRNAELREPSSGCQSRFQQPQQLTCRLLTRGLLGFPPASAAISENKRLTSWIAAVAELPANDMASGSRSETLPYSSPVSQGESECTRFIRFVIWVHPGPICG